MRDKFRNQWNHSMSGTGSLATVHSSALRSRHEGLGMPANSCRCTCTEGALGGWGWRQRVFDPSDFQPRLAPCVIAGMLRLQAWCQKDPGRQAEGERGPGSKCTRPRACTDTAGQRCCTRHLASPVCNQAPTLGLAGSCMQPRTRLTRHPGRNRSRARQPTRSALAAPGLWTGSAHRHRRRGAATAVLLRQCCWNSAGSSRQQRS